MIFNIDKDIKNAEFKIQHGCVQERHEILYYVAKKMQPKNYLEIGVWMGRSMALVLKASPETQGYGIDTWASYASRENATPEKLRVVFESLDIVKLPIFFSGSSIDILPLLWMDNKRPQLFDVILVDGDHNYETAQQDLEFCFPHLAEGGILVFHDTTSYPWLADIFSDFKKKLIDCIFLESCFEEGTSIILKLPLSGKIFCR